MADNAPQYQLRCELRSHTEDVRCICTIDSTIATGSRDKTIKLWHQSEDSTYSLHSTLIGHTDYVSAIAYSQANDTLISGSRDTSLIIWDTNSATPSHTLKGHKYQVSSLAVIPSTSSSTTPTIVSASLDATLRLWNNNTECTAVLEGHEAAILSVLALDDGDTILSGSGDCTVKAWSLSSKSCTSTIQAHTDSVRAMAHLPGIGIVTGSHDCTVKTWTLSGECISELVGHTALVYSVSVTTDGTLIASGSEDSTVKIWRVDGTCIQTIEHPGCVWAVDFLPNGDLITGCSDGVARVWSVEEGRWAEKEVRDAYDMAIIARKEAATSAANGNTTNGDATNNNGLPAGLTLEDPSALQTPGTRDGQTKIIREGQSGVAYSWDASANHWERIGEVVSGPDTTTTDTTITTGRKWYNGREWDYVFDVDVADGAPPLKLAMDADENPYIVADRFIDAHELPVGYREQIVSFILQNTGGNRGGTANTTTQQQQYVDPYTGASAYVPPPPSSQQQQQQQQQHYGITGGGADPYTGYSSGLNAKKHVPLTTYMLFDTAPPVDGLRKKLHEFNSEVTIQQQQHQLTDGEDSMVEQLLAAISSPPGSIAAITPASDVCTVLLPKLLSWPVPQLFPCLDITRVLLLDQNIAAFMASSSSSTAQGSILNALINVAQYSNDANNAPSQASVQVALRCACNLFAHSSFLTWLRENALSLIAMYLPSATSSSATKGIRLGFSTFLINTAVFVTKLPGDELQTALAVVDAVATVLSSCPVEDEEARYRALCALGTLLPEHSQIRGFAREKGLLGSVGDVEKSSQQGRMKEVAVEVTRLLRL